MARIARIMADYNDLADENVNLQARVRRLEAEIKRLKAALAAKDEK